MSAESGVVGTTFAQVPEWLLEANVSSRAIHLYAVLQGRAGKKGATWPSRKTLAGQMRCSPDTVDRAIAELVEVDALRVEPRWDDDGDRTSNRYVLLSERPDLRSGGRMDAQTGGGTSAQENQTKSEPDPLFGAEQARAPEGSSKPPALRKPRAPDPVWDAMVDACGLAGTSPTPGERGKWNKAAKELRSAEATPEEIHRRAQTYRRRYPQTTITPLALSNNWATLGVNPSESNGVSEVEFRARKAAPWL
jgi:hypothetical protein